jgi:hypothetical protein
MALDPLGIYVADLKKCLLIKNDGGSIIYGYPLSEYDSSVTGTHLRVDGDMCVSLKQTTTDGILTVTTNDGTKYTIADQPKRQLFELCELATSSDKLFGKKTITKYNNSELYDGFVFAIFTKTSIYTTNGTTSILQNFDIDITDSIDNSTLSLDITVDAEGYQGETMNISVPIDEINPGNPYLYLVYFYS